jgi:hypothetical protein
MQQYTPDCSDKVSNKDVTLFDIKSISSTKQSDAMGSLPSILKEPTKKKKIRCCHKECNKKLSVVDKTMGECKCNNLYCQIHRDTSKHDCSYDWHTNKKEELTIQLNSNRCVATKLTAI